MKEHIMTGKDSRCGVMCYENVAKTMINRCIDWEKKVNLDLDRNTATRKQLFK